MSTANYWIDKLKLAKHPEGGYFKEVYRSKEMFAKKSLPDRYEGERSFSTSIYFLLKSDEFSSFHRIKSDETWHFYEGTTLELYVLNQHNIITKHLLGRDPEEKEQLQVTIPRDHWFGARVKDPNSYTLTGCTVAPGFHFDDFELADRKSMLEQFPEHKDIIRALTF